MSDELERIIRPIVEGQIRGFIKEHPSILKGVDWYKPSTDKARTLSNSLSKRIVRDLLCPTTRARLVAAVLAPCSEPPPNSSVEPPTAAEAGRLVMVAERPVRRRHFFDLAMVWSVLNRRAA